jgi:hypothetical protein
MKWMIFSIAFLGIGISIQAQGVRIGSGNNPPHPSAGLDVDFTDRGMLPPRLTTTQRNGISNPAPGLVIYNTSSQCLEVYLPQSGWNQALCDCPNPPSAAISSGQGTSLGLNQSSTFSASQPGNISSYQWNFQGGTPASSVASNPSVSWSQAGTYWVVLNVSDAQGCSDSDSIQVTVSNQGTTLNTFDYFTSGQQYLLRGSQYNQLSDQQTADCFCQMAGFSGAVSFTVGNLSTTNCFGYGAGCQYYATWCSGSTNRHVIPTVTCQ